ncbi:MAG: hypothetical protein NXI10_11455 [bacterium]|nr:hypothetical protein [bacterium]
MRSKLVNIKRWSMMLALLIVWMPRTSLSQTKLKIREGIRSHTFKVNDKIRICRDGFYEFDFEEAATIQGFTADAIILGEEGEYRDTVAISDLYKVSTESKNFQFDDWVLIPVGVSFIALYISPFTGFTNEGYEPKNVLIVGGSAIAFNGILFGIGSIGRAKAFTLCEAKIKMK